jgi:serine/threonine protein kinase
LQYIHSRNIIHRDLKPSNIAMGVGVNVNVVYLIDFGLSKEFRDPNTHLHIPFKHGLGPIGTASFASINSHLGLELGRRDDVESLVYMLLYFLWGSLPWLGPGTKDEDILESKRNITSFDAFRQLPPEFHLFFNHCRSLSFDGRPDYERFRCTFSDLLVREGFQDNLVFDWEAPHDENPGRALRPRNGRDGTRRGHRASYKRRKE